MRMGTGIMTMRSEPMVLVFAGPNGSGKSTITRFVDTVGLYINADDIKAAKGIDGLSAAKEAELVREYCVSKKESFTFETVLSTERNYLLLQRAKAAGYYVKVVFVLTCDSELNVARVKSRVLANGHDVPEDKIKSRYVKSIKFIPKLIELSDEITIFDNSGDVPKIIYHKDGLDEFVCETRTLSIDEVYNIVNFGGSK